MKKNSFYATEKNTLNPLFQQQFPQGRVQVKDMAFFNRKLSFIKCQLQNSSITETKGAENEGGYHEAWNKVVF